MNKTKIFLSTLCFLRIVMPTVLMAATFSAQAQTTLSNLFWTTPNVVFDDQEFKINIHFQGSSSTIYSLKASSDKPIMNDTIHLNYTISNVSPHIPYGPEMGRASYTLPPLPAGKYTIAVNPEEDDSYHPILEFSFNVLKNAHRGFRKVGHESPAPNETVSGVGLIRGWACQEHGDIGKVMYQIDHGSLNTFDQKKLKLPYGSGRADTNAACNQGNASGRDNNTGYGGVVNWNAYSAGQHHFKLWVDGTLASSHPFYVAKTHAAFQTGLSAEITVPNFPSTSNTSTLRWSEADQNFILIETQSD